MTHTEVLKLASFDQIKVTFDGESRRCFCGNRRVGWIMDNPAPGKWKFYAEAY